jgi:hypothetical protein
MATRINSLQDTAALADTDYIAVDQPAQTGRLSIGDLRDQIIPVPTPLPINLADCNFEHLLMELNTNSEIGAGETDYGMQGFAIDTVNSKVYITHRVKGTSGTSLEETRILQYALRNDGNTYLFEAKSANLLMVGHGQDLSIEYNDKENNPTDITLWTRGRATEPTYEASQAKGVASINISGGVANVTDANVKNHTLFEAYNVTPSGTNGFNKITPTVSRDGKYLVGYFQNEHEAEDRRIGIWDLNTVKALADDAAFVSDIMLNSFPVPRNGRNVVQGIVMDDDYNIYLGSGGSQWEEMARVAKISFDGTLQDLIFISQERPLTPAGLTNNQHEMEGLDIMEVNGQMHIMSGHLRDGSTIKRIYGHGYGELLNTVRDKMPASGAPVEFTISPSTRDIIYKDDNSLQIGQFNPDTGEYADVMVLDSVGNVEIKNVLQLVSSNTAGTIGNILQSNTEGREILLIRGKNTSQDDCGWINMYGDTDSSFPSEVLIGGGTNASGIRISSDAVAFYGTAPIAKQTGVPVTVQGIHDALVALGLIS